MGLRVEGREVNTLADSGSQVNTVMPGYMRQYEFPVLPLHDLVDNPLNLIGLGGTRTHPVGFVILRVQVNEITGYNEDVVFLVVPNESKFSQHIPLMTGTCTLGRIVNVIKESELDRLSTPLGYGEGFPPIEQVGHCGRRPRCSQGWPSTRGGTAPESPGDWDVDKPVFMEENVRLGPFQTQILECKVKPLIGGSAHVIVMPLRAGES